MIQKPSYRTGNYALTAVLRTLGYPWALPEQPCANKYSPPELPQRDKRGRLRKLGKVTFMISSKSDEYPDTPLRDVLAACDNAQGSPAGDELDAAIDGIADEGARATLQKLLPLAYAECARNALANLRAVKETPHSCQAHIVIRKPDGMPVIIPENATDEVLERWGIKFKEASA